MVFDSVQVGTANLEEGARDYALLLGQPGERRGDRHRFAFERGALELIEAEPGVRSLRFRIEGGESWPVGRDEYNGIEVLHDAEQERTPLAPASDVIHAIDHVVVNSPDLDRAIALWRDRLGVRLALDREFPQRGLRILFLRSGGVTLEFSGAFPRPEASAGADTLWGIAYQAADVEACRQRLLAAGVGVSEVRAGQKRGTLVATAKSHTLGVPTLLIQPVDWPGTRG